MYQCSRGSGAHSEDLEDGRLAIMEAVHVGQTRKSSGDFVQLFVTPLLDFRIQNQEEYRPSNICLRLRQTCFEKKYLNVVDVVSLPAANKSKMIP